MQTIPVERGCGRRVKGGIYWEVASSPFGRPIEDFLFDPPKLIDEQALGITPIGVQLVQLDGVWHVMDVVGSTHYPNVADFIEEARRFGISRRLSSRVEFGRLSVRSRLLLAHRRAWVDQLRAYHQDLAFCPKQLGHHPPVSPGFQEPCAGIWWDDIEGGEPVMQDPENNGRRDFRLVERKMPSFSYHGRARPRSVKAPRYRLALFGSFPLGGIVVVKDPEGKEHEARVAELREQLTPALQDRLEVVNA